MITVTTPNGRVGSRVLRHLLDADETVRVISYCPEKLSRETRGRCEIVEGSLRHVDTQKRGFEGADAIFWCIPQSSEGNRWDDARETTASSPRPRPLR